MAARMEAEDDGGFLGMFESNPLGTDVNTVIGTDFEGGPQAPNLGPPRAARGWPQDRAVLLAGQIPRPLTGILFPGSILLSVIFLFSSQRRDSIR